MFQFAVLLSTVAFALCASAPDVTIPQLDGRIAGGKNVTIEDAPWQCSFQRNFQHICSCTIIKSKYVVITADCLSSPPHSGYSVRVASNKWWSGGKMHWVTWATAHEHYNRSTSENNIAVAKLFNKIKFSKKAQPIRLSSSSPALGDTATVSGWKLIKCPPNEHADLLNIANAIIMDNSFCESTNGYEKLIDDSMMCVHEFNFAYQVDSGGSLVTNGELQGIKSWGSGCDNRGKPAVYTKVCKFADWINNNTR